MDVSILLIVAGLVLLYLGAEGLVRGSAALAVCAGLTPLVLMRTGFRLVQWEGAVLVALYAGYVCYLIP